MKRCLKSNLMYCILLFATLNSCNTSEQKDPTIINELQYRCVQQLTDVIVHDIVNPPVASRMYVYSNIAFYEALRITDQHYTSLLPDLKGFITLKSPDTTVQRDYHLSAMIAFMKVAEALVFSKDSIRAGRKLL